jgi:hypothetical protein
VILKGAQQVPPIETTGIRTGNLTYDPGRRLITWSLTYDGLSGPAMMAHIHGPAAEGRNGPLATIVHAGSHRSIDLAYGALATHVARYERAADGPLREH